MLVDLVAFVSLHIDKEVGLRTLAIENFKNLDSTHPYEIAALCRLAKKPETLIVAGNEKMCSKFKNALIDGMISSTESSFIRGRIPKASDNDLRWLWWNFKEMFGIRFGSVQVTDMKELTLKNLGVNHT